MLDLSVLIFRILMVLSCLSFQMKSIIKNETGIESWIIDKVKSIEGKGSS